MSFGVSGFSRNAGRSIQSLTAAAACGPVIARSSTLSGCTRRAEHELQGAEDALECMQGAIAG